MRLLLVEDNPDLVLFLSKILHQEGFRVETVGEAEMAMALLGQELFDAILLDINLPHASGLSVLRYLRAERNNTPILMITASDSLNMKVDALEMGADDYLVKPFEVRELIARVKALIRRSNAHSGVLYECGDLHYDPDSRQFSISDQLLALPAREHQLLEIFIQKPNQTLSKDYLMQNLFGLGEEGSEDAIELYICRLRKKLEASSAAIVTLRGLGYIMTQKNRE